MINDHPREADPLVGRQLRYLIGYRYGWLGEFVAGMSRFLIRLSVQCRNLVSKVLSLSLPALPDDYKRRFG